MSSRSHSVQRSPRKKKRLLFTPVPTTGTRRPTARNKRHGRKAMANGLRSRSYLRQNSDELVINNTSHLIRRPLSISSSTSSSSSVGEGDGSGDGYVVDLTRDRGSGVSDESRASRRGASHGPRQSGAGGQSGSTLQGRNVLIIDSDEEVLEMEMPPTPPHQTHTRTKNLKKGSNQSKTGSGSSSSSDVVCCEDLKPTDSNHSSDGKSSAVKNPSPSKTSSRSIIQCPICMETVQQFEKEGRQLTATRCGHIFCNVCIREAAKAQRKCPTCRKPVTLRGGFHELFIPY